MVRGLAILFITIGLCAWCLAQTEAAHPVPATRDAALRAPSQGARPSTDAAATVEPIVPVAPLPPLPGEATTRSAHQSAEDMLRQMLQPTTQGAQPLRPIESLPPPVDLTGGVAAVMPNATTQPLAHEGSTILDRIGRLTKLPTGQLQITFDSDGPQMSDPPMLLLPNKALASLEDLVNNSYADLKIRVSGEVTEYRGRNYLLLQKWAQVQSMADPFQ